MKLPPDQKTIITTVSIPRLLRERMYNFQVDNYVNWSEVACEAWEWYMDKVEGKHKEKGVLV